MAMSKQGCQTIGCRVTSCAYNRSGSMCDLDRVEIEPMNAGHTGKPEDESLCASYKSR